MHDVETEGGLDALLQVLLLEGEISHAVSAGIARQVIDQGVGSLSAAQERVFRMYVLEPLCDVPCARCGSAMPYGEVIGARENGGYCGWCDDQMTEDD